MSPDNESPAISPAPPRRQVRIPDRVLSAAEQSAVVESAIAELRAQGDQTPEDQLRRDVRRALRRHQKQKKAGSVVVTG